MTPSFRRNSAGFTEYLSSLLTRTITHHPLTATPIPGREQARLRFRDADSDGYVPLNNGCAIHIRQRIGPHPEDQQKVTTLEYLYAFRIGADPAHEPLVRYEYVPEEVAHSDYRYPKGHMHISMDAPDYDAFIAPYETKPIHQVHFPTGRITLEEFIRLLIIEFHVPPLNDVASALALLEASQRGFLEEKKTKD
jgi:hypothetical protein